MKAPNKEITQNVATEGTKELNIRNAKHRELGKNSLGERIPPTNWFEKDRQKYLEDHPGHKLAPSLGWIPEQLPNGPVRWWHPDFKDLIPEDAIIIKMP